MEKIDRLGWAAGFSFVAYVRRIGVRSNDPSMLDKVRPVLPYGSRPVSGGTVERMYSIIAGGGDAGAKVRRFNVLYGDWDRIARTMDLGELLEALEVNMRMFAAEFARRRIFIHAGVVGVRGQAILIPGRSFTGKTTLVAELVRAGARYYSDEFAVLDERGRVHPFLKPLSLREGSGYGQTDHPVERFGMPGEKPLPVGLVVVSEYGEGASWEPQLLSPGEGALELLANAVAARRDPERVLSTLQEVVSQAPVLKGDRGEARETAEAILEMLKAGPDARGELGPETIKR